jgi:hypothetical protein
MVDRYALMSKMAMRTGWTAETMLQLVCRYLDAQGGESFETWLWMQYDAEMTQEPIPL